MDDAYDRFLEMNPEPLEIGEDEDGDIYMVEDWIDDEDDEDPGVYVFEYFATPDGECAIAFCRESPWGDFDPDDFMNSHVDGDGFLCLGHGSTRELEESPFDLEYVILRARYWATAYSYYRENGHFPQPE